MNTKELLRMAVTKSGMSQAKIAEKAGFKSQGGVGNMLAKGAPGMQSVIRLLNVCGYKVMIVSDRKGEPDIEMTAEEE